MSIFYVIKIYLNNVLTVCFMFYPKHAKHVYVK